MGSVLAAVTYCLCFGRQVLNSAANCDAVHRRSSATGGAARVTLRRDSRTRDSLHLLSQKLLLLMKARRSILNIQVVEMRRVQPRTLTAEELLLGQSPWVDLSLLRSRAF